MVSEDYISTEALAAPAWRRPFSRKKSLALLATLTAALGLSFMAPSGFDRLASSAQAPAALPSDAAADYAPEVISSSLTEILGLYRLDARNAGDGELDNYDDLLPANALTDSDEEISRQVRDLAAGTGGKAPGGRWLEENVQRGDTLSSLFEDLNIPPAVTMNLLRDAEVAREINRLRLGERLSFMLDDEGALLAFVKPLDSRRQLRVWRENASGSQFSHGIEPLGAHLSDSSPAPAALAAAQAGSQPGAAPAARPPEASPFENRGRLVLVKIERGDSFSSAANRVGVSYSEINTIMQMFKGRIQFSRNIQPGDTMRVLFTDKGGKGRIAAVEFNLRRGGTLTSYLNPADNKYYDEKGFNSAQSSFKRIPFNAKVRVTSSFDPGRKHPVTGVVRPHNGTDFGLPIGTTIIAPADGVVDKAAYSRTAGYYVVLRHRGGWSTVYMHLSKILVKQGQSVKMGGTIARSGNTGISTGPHLHYELRINGKAVNAMRVNLGARDAEVNAAQRKRFQNSVAQYKRELHQDSLIASN